MKLKYRLFLLALITASTAFTIVRSVYGGDIDLTWDNFLSAKQNLIDYIFYSRSSNVSALENRQLWTSTYRTRFLELTQQLKQGSFSSDFLNDFLNQYSSYHTTRINFHLPHQNIRADALSCANNDYRIFAGQVEKDIENSFGYRYGSYILIGITLVAIAAVVALARMPNSPGAKPVEQELNELRETIESQSTKIKELTLQAGHQNGELQQRLSELKTSYDGLTEKYNALVNDYRSASHVSKEQLKELTSDLSKLSKEVASQNTDLLSRCAQNNNFTLINVRSTQGLSSEIKDTQAKLEYLDFKVKLEAQAVDQLVTEIECLDYKVEDAVSSLNTNIGKSLKNLDTKIDTTAAAMKSEVDTSLTEFGTQQAQQSMLLNKQLLEETEQLVVKSKKELSNEVMPIVEEKLFNLERNLTKQYISIDSKVGIMNTDSATERSKITKQLRSDYLDKKLPERFNALADQYQLKLEKQFDEQKAKVDAAVDAGSARRASLIDEVQNRMTSNFSKRYIELSDKVTANRDRADLDAANLAGKIAEVKTIAEDNSTKIAAMSKVNANLETGMNRKIALLEEMNSGNLQSILDLRDTVITNKEEADVLINKHADSLETLFTKVNKAERSLKKGAEDVVKNQNDLSARITEVKATNTVTANVQESILESLKTAGIPCSSSDGLAQEVIRTVFESQGPF